MSTIELGSFSFANEEDKKSNNRNEASGDVKEPVAWRQDPHDSLSDWTITLKLSEQSRIVDEVEPTCFDANINLQMEFHVHRVFLGVGPRRSLYFERLFKSNQNLAEKVESRSTVEVQASAAKAFPAMLDYMYSPHTNEPLDVSTESAVALRWLANYFGIEPMYIECSKFLEKDLAVTTAIRYLQEAREVSDDLLVGAAVTVCIEKFKQVDSDALLRLEPADFSPVFLGAIKAAPASDTIYSKRVASYCAERSEGIAPGMFQTWIDHLPVIDSGAAIALLHYNDFYGLSNNLTRTRCIDSLSTRWSEERFIGSSAGSLIEEEEDVNEWYSCYSELRDTTKIEVLECALERARRDHRASYNEQAKLHRKYRRLKRSLKEAASKHAKHVADRTV